MFDESRYPTQKVLRCRQCGAVFVGSLSGAEECPECDSDDRCRYRPGEGEPRERAAD